MLRCPRQHRNGQYPQRRVLSQLKRHSPDHTVARAYGTLTFHRWRNHLNAGIAIYAQRPLRPKRDHNAVRFPTLYDFLRGLAHIIGLSEFTVYQCTQFFEVGFDQFDIADG